MTAVTHREQFRFTKPGDRCTVCRNPVKVPHVEWVRESPKPLVICAECCRDLRPGLVPDLNRVVAFEDFRRLPCEGVPAH
jgi:hypothetical protein